VRIINYEHQALGSFLAAADFNALLSFQILHVLSFEPVIIVSPS